MPAWLWNFLFTGGNLHELNEALVFVQQRHSVCTYVAEDLFDYPPTHTHTHTQGGRSAPRKPVETGTHDKDGVDYQWVPDGALPTPSTPLQLSSISVYYIIWHGKSFAAIFVSHCKYSLIFLMLWLMLTSCIYNYFRRLCLTFQCVSSFLTRQLD